MTKRDKMDKAMSGKDADAMVEISMSNFNRTRRDAMRGADVRVRCIYDCDCTVVGGTDPIPPFGTASGVVAYGVGDMTS